MKCASTLCLLPGLACRILFAGSLANAPGGTMAITATCGDSGGQFLPRAVA